MKNLSVGSQAEQAGLRTLFLLFCLAFVIAGPLTVAELQAAEPSPGVESAVNQPGDASKSSLDEAIKQTRQKVAAAPSSEDDLLRLGYLLLKKGSLSEAGKTFDGVLSINDRNHDALTGKGIVLARMGKDQEAEKTLEKALILNPNPVRTYYELGSLYEKKGDFAKAIVAYKKGIEKYKQGRK